MVLDAVEMERQWRFWKEGGDIAGQTSQRTRNMDFFFCCCVLNGFKHWEAGGDDVKARKEDSKVVKT